MTGRPFEVVSSRELAAHHHYSLRADEVRWPDGTETSYGVFIQPQAAVMVPLTEELTTFIVRQWRHSWEMDAWECPAGTVEEGEDPAATARRELIEEAGLSASRWDPLGTARATAVSTMRFNLYLARDLERVERRPEIYERDMVIRELPLAEALDLAADGTIQHAASIAALFRASRALGRS
ncbi:MAG TPA: NUDIX hydrolase [Candidatus Dormibacteraeota bacterium]|nr:NUDIX hydrolase [Candidatus Dormibacteraeota bacterium]